MRTPIVFYHFFYCSLAYSEGGRVENFDFFAYVIKVWPLVAILVLAKNIIRKDNVRFAAHSKREGRSD